MTFPSGAVLLVLLFVAACTPASTDSPEFPVENTTAETEVAEKPQELNNSEEATEAEAIEEIRLLLEDDFEYSLADLDALK